MLADEPTSSLDPESSHAVMELLTEIAADEQIPVLINIHEVELAVEYADRIIGLADGELVFDGSPDTLDDSARDRIYRNGEERGRDLDSREPSRTATDSSDDTIIENEMIRRGYE